MLILQQVPHLPLIAVDTHRRQTGLNAFVPGQHVLFGIVQKLIQNPGTERIKERVKGEKKFSSVLSQHKAKGNRGGPTPTD